MVWIVLVLILGWGLEVSAQNAPGNLPWGVSPEGALPPATDYEKHDNFLTPIGGFLGGEVFRHAYGTAWFGYDSLNTSGYGQFNTADVGLSLSSSGFILDPRLWSHIISINLDHFSATGSGSKDVGFYLNGTLLRKRSFPLRVTLVRRTADGTSLDFQNHDNYHAEILDWTLKQPKFATVGITATFAGSGQDLSSIGLPSLGSTVENERNLNANVTRTILGFVVTGAAFNYHITGSSTGATQGAYELTTRGGNVGVQRHFHLGDRGDLQIFASRQESHASGVSTGFSSFGSPANSFSFTNARAMLTYHHTDKLTGIYGADYLSNITQQAIATAVQGSGIGLISPGQLNPGLFQSLSSPLQSSSTAEHGDWLYRATKDLSFNWGAAETSLSLPLEFTANEPQILAPVTGYTSASGGVTYTRPIGKWNLSWYGRLTRNWDRVQEGNGFVEDSRVVGLGVARKIDRWHWKSDFTYSEYLPNRPGLTTNIEQRWTNVLQTSLSPGMLLDVSADLAHTNLNVAYPSVLLMNLASQASANTMLLTRAALHTRRWDFSGGTGLRYLDMRNLSDISNPLLIPMATSADHYANASSTFKMRQNLSFHGEYRRDNFADSTGDTIRYSGMEFSVAYRLKKLVVEGGYERQNQIISGHGFDFNRLYVRIQRPFRLY